MSPASLSSSYDYVSARSNSQSESFGVLSDDTASDIDEIVWSISDLSVSSLSMSGSLAQQGLRARSPATFSEEDYIVLSRARSPAHFVASPGSPNSLSSDVARAIEQELSAAISALSLTQATPKASATAALVPTRFDIHRALSIPADTSSSSARSSSQKKGKKGKAVSPEHPAGGAGRTPKARKEKKKAKASSAAVPGSSPPSSPSKKKVKTPTKKANAAGPTHVQVSSPSAEQRAIVDDVSEIGDAPADALIYQDAVAYISSFLSNPTTKSGASNLKLLQALIIELGLCPSALLPCPTNSVPFPSLPSLPHSLRAAKALLKSQVFLNVRDYLAVRGQGVEALRRAMHPNRVSLLREVRSGKGLPLKTIKDAGLNVLLITCH